MGWVAHQVGPRNGNVRASAVGQHQQEMRPAFVPQLSEDLEHLAIQGVVPAGYTHLCRKVSEVGSVS